MALTTILTALQADVAQCDNLIARAHGLDPTGIPILPAIDRKQITVAAFLNLFIAWETFLEAALSDYMTGQPTISGRLPVRYAIPPNGQIAKSMLIGTQRYFDYGNHENVKKAVLIFFQHGDPFEPHLSALMADLADIRTMRNSSAHITSTTQTALESLALRLFGAPRPGIDLYSLITSSHPSVAGGGTVFTVYRDKLLAGATLIAQG